MCREKSKFREQILSTHLPTTCMEQKEEGTKSARWDPCGKCGLTGGHKIWNCSSLKGELALGVLGRHSRVPMSLWIVYFVLRWIVKQPIYIFKFFLKHSSGWDFPSRNYNKPQWWRDWLGSSDTANISALGSFHFQVIVKSEIHLV